MLIIIKLRLCLFVHSLLTAEIKSAHYGVSTFKLMYDALSTQEPLICT